MKEGNHGASTCNLHWFGVVKNCMGYGSKYGQGLGLGLRNGGAFMVLEV